jgi:hypothetical protein
VAQQPPEPFVIREAAGGHLLFYRLTADLKQGRFFL